MVCFNFFNFIFIHFSSSHHYLCFYQMSKQVVLIYLHLHGCIHTLAHRVGYEALDRYLTKSAATAVTNAETVTNGANALVNAVGEQSLLLQFYLHPSLPAIGLTYSVITILLQRWFARSYVSQISRNPLSSEISISVHSGFSGNITDPAVFRGFQVVDAIQSSRTKVPAKDTYISIPHPTEPSKRYILHTGEQHYIPNKDSVFKILGLKVDASAPSSQEPTLNDLNQLTAQKPSLEEAIANAEKLQKELEAKAGLKKKGK